MLYGLYERLIYSVMYYLRILKTQFQIYKIAIGSFLHLISWSNDAGDFFKLITVCSGVKSD